MSRNYFTISELCITDDPVPQSVADKLLAHHIEWMNTIRERLGKPITASRRSGYRPVDYELARGRSGNSQHTFQGKGAVDWMTPSADPKDFWRLLSLIIERTPYTRICVYGNSRFIHCDYASDVRQLFECDGPGSQWRHASEGDYINPWAGVIQVQPDKVKEEVLKEVERLADEWSGQENS